MIGLQFASLSAVFMGTATTDSARFVTAGMTVANSLSLPSHSWEYECCVFVAVDFFCFDEVGFKGIKL